MRLSSTSSQRTYRYLRIAIVGAVVALAVGVIVVFIADGPITSISAMYYTTGSTVFVGAMCAIALALVALSGHSVEQVLLDIAAVFVAMIAVVPTPVGPGDVTGSVPLCTTGVVCVPPAEIAGARTGVIVLAVTALLGALAAVVLALGQRAMGIGVAVGAGAAALAGIALIVWLAMAPSILFAVGHLVATAVFFGIMVAVAIISAVTAPHISPRRRRGSAPRRGSARPVHVYTVIYTVVAVGMVACLVFLFAVEIARRAGADLTGQPWVLAGEVGLVAFFAVFWIAQTAQKWDETDPSVLPSA